MQAQSQVTSATSVDVSSAIAAAFPTQEQQPVFMTVEQFAEAHPAFTSASLRNLIFKAEPRKSSRGDIPGNGLAEAGAIVRLGRRVLLHESRFLGWVARGGARR